MDVDGDRQLHGIVSPKPVPSRDEHRVCKQSGGQFNDTIALDQMAADRDKGTEPLSSDRLFHLRIAEASGNSALALVVKTLWDQRTGPLFLRLEHHFDSPALWDVAIDEHPVTRVEKAYCVSTDSEPYAGCAAGGGSAGGGALVLATIAVVTIRSPRSRRARRASPVV